MELLAFQTAIFFIAILPGFAFRLSFRKAYPFRPLREKTLSEQMAEALVSALLIHFYFQIVYLPFGKLFNLRIDYDLIWSILSGQRLVDSEPFASQLAPYSGYILVYVLASLIVPSGLSRLVVRNAFQSDIDFRRRFWKGLLFILSPITHLTLRGRVNWIDSILEKRYDPDVAAIAIAAVVEISGKAYIYMGFLYDIVFSEEKPEIENLHLIGCSRHLLCDVETKYKPYKIYIEHVILKWEEIKNFGFHVITEDQFDEFAECEDKVEADTV